MTFAQWISVGLSAIVAIAGSGVLTVAITSYVNRDKLPADITKTKAEAAAVISDAAIKLAIEQDKRFDRLREAWGLHREWDKQQVKRMHEAGWDDVQDPPDVWF